MLATQCLRRLLVDRPGQPHLSSASGLALAGDHLYIVADDERHLAVLDARDVAGSALRLVRFAPGTLPADAKQRKAVKPDLESLIALPAEAPDAPSLLVAWGSCSRPQREFGHVFTLDAEGALAGDPDKVSLAPLCDRLRARYGELNLEAGFVQGGELNVFQRAHGGQPVNGHVRYAARTLRDWLTGASGDVPVPLAMADLDLGRVDGVPLGITDAAAWGEGWIFTAVAEDTSDAYADGTCVGSVVGWVDAAGRVQRCERLAGAPKAEGLAVAGPGRLWLVTDADDPARASELLELRWLD